MSKSKRGKSVEKQATGPPKWEAALAGASYQTENWKVNIYIIAGNKYEDEQHIETLLAAVQGGQRRYFSVITRTAVFAKIYEYGNPKTLKGKKDAPAYSEICETAKSVLDSGNDLTPSMIARLIKWRLLDIRECDLRRRDAQKKREAALAGGATGAAAGGKRSKSPSKKGKKTPEPTPSKAGSKIKKRHEEELDRVYIDDEPDDGPQHYVFIHGFYNADVITALTDLPIEIEAIIKLMTEDYSRYPEYVPPMAEELTDADEAVIKERVKKKKDMYKFWIDMGTLIDKQLPDSTLHQTPELEYTIKNSIIPDNNDDAEAKTELGTLLFEDLACMAYDLIDSKRQHKAYLENLKLIHIPLAMPAQQPESARSSSPAGEATEEVTIFSKNDMRYYIDLMNCIPQECVTIPLILHCMLEQVVATETGSIPPSEVLPEPRADGLDLSVAAHLNQLVFKLALSGDEQESLIETFDNPLRKPDKPKTPIIFTHADDIMMRTHHLSAKYGFSPQDIEFKMLEFSPFIDLPDFPEPSKQVQKIQAARLRELLHFCSSPALPIYEIDHAFRQFVFECMELAVTDENMFVAKMEQEGARQHTIPWDDPYIAHVSLLSHSSISEGSRPSSQPASSPRSQHVSCSVSVNEDTTNEPNEKTDSKVAEIEKGPDINTSLKVYSPDKVGDGKDTDKVLTAPKSREKFVHLQTPIEDQGDGKRDKHLTGILRSAHSRITSAQSVRFEPRDDIGHPTMDNNEFPDDVSIMSEQLAIVSDTEKMCAIVNSRHRDLTEWCFMEYYEPHVLLQVLNKAAETLPYLDTYYHKRDNTLLVVLHNPLSAKLKIVEEWKSELYSNLGFRKYVDLIEDKVRHWMNEEDARYDARRLSEELEKLNLQEVMSKSSTKGSAKTKGTPKTSAKQKKSAKSSTTSSTDKVPQHPDDIFKRPPSLKYQKEEQDRIKAEEEDKERQKNERSRSPKGKDKKDDRSKKSVSASSRTASKTKIRRESEVTPVVVSEVQDEEVEEAYHPFSGYDMGDKVINVNGMTTTMFPTDGGQIKLERCDILKGTTSVKCSLMKDEHTFVIHILDPHDTPLPPQDPEVIEYERRKEEERLLNETANQDLGIIDLTESIVENRDLAAKPSISAFASMTARFKDGLTLSYSTFGDSGQSDILEKKKNHESCPPSVVASPVPPIVKDAGTKSKKSTAGKIITPEPVAIEVPPEKPKIDQTFQTVHVSCPDGLIVTYILESSLGIMPLTEEDRRLAVKMSYPYMTAGEQKCESVKKRFADHESCRVITCEGTVYKHLRDGNTEVLFSNGTILRSFTENVIKDTSTFEVKQERIESSKKSARSSKSQGLSDKIQPAPQPEEGKQTTWSKTYPNGEQLLVKNENVITPLNDVMLYVATDPQTKKSMATRDDNVITVSDPDGSLIVEHADGTRITTYYRAQTVPMDVADNQETGEDVDSVVDYIKFVKVECPGYPTVEYNCMTTESLARFGNGSSLNVYSDGYYMLHNIDGSKFEIDVEGVGVYYPKAKQYLETMTQSQELIYVLRHNSDILCETVDIDGNMFQARFNGEGIVSLSEAFATKQHDILNRKSIPRTSGAHKVINYKNHAPRLFTLYPDGSGMELLRYQDVADYITEADNSYNTAVIQEILPDQNKVSAITMLKPYLGTYSDTWANEYDAKYIVPEGIKNRDLSQFPRQEYVVPGPSFGTTLGQGLSVGTAVKKPPCLPVTKCPTKLEIRQIFQYMPISTATRNQLVSGLRNYRTYIEQRHEFAEMLKPIEVRSLEEQENADYLQNIALSIKQINDRHPVQLSALYEDKLTPKPPPPPPRPAPQRTAADWARDMRELQEEAHNKAILRERKIPPYFTSELGKAFLNTESKDMTELMRELTDGVLSPNLYRSRDEETPVQSGDAFPDESHSEQRNVPATPPPTEATDTCRIKDSDITIVSPRPLNPTPGQAQGDRSPSLTRPTNPTPNHGQTSKLSFYPESILEESPKPTRLRNKVLLKSVEGYDRLEPVPLPVAVKGGRPGSFPNIKFSQIEEPVRRKVNNTCIIGGTYRGRIQLKELRGLNIHPQRLNFGVLKEGNTYAFKFYLKNTGVDTCRFKLEQPPLSTGISVLYKPGPVAAGMSKALEVEIYAIASVIEADGGVGQINHHLRITTETDAMFLPITATVLTAYDYDHGVYGNLPEEVGASGRRLVSTTPPSLCGVIRPKKTSSPLDNISNFTDNSSLL